MRCIDQKILDCGHEFFFLAKTVARVVVTIHRGICDLVFRDYVSRRDQERFRHPEFFPVAYSWSIHRFPSLVSINNTFRASSAADSKSSWGLAKMDAISTAFFFASSSTVIAILHMFSLLVEGFQAARPDPALIFARPSMALIESLVS
jgi:hypothetical protein